MGERCSTCFILMLLILRLFYPEPSFAAGNSSEILKNNSCLLVEGDFRLTIQNDIALSNNLLEFDLCIFSADTAQPFELASVQVGILLDPAILNTGEVICMIKNNSSSLVISQRPTTVVFNPQSFCIELYPKPLPGAGSGTIISTDSLNPTRICRIRIGNSVPWATGQPNLSFVFSSSGFPTLVSRYVNGENTGLLCDSSNCYSLANNNTLNYPPPPLPVPFTVSGSGTYCPEDFPVQAGIDSSEVNVTYRFYKDGVLTDSQDGTGAGLSWNCPEAGVYTIEGINASGSMPMSNLASIAEIPEPEVYLSSGNTAVCAGTLATFNALVANPGLNPEFLWHIFNSGGSEFFTTTVPVFSYNPVPGDIVSVDYYVTDPCFFIAESNIVLMTVYTASEGGLVSGNNTIYLGSSTGVMSLTGYNGNIIKWQKCHDKGAWQDIYHVQSTLSETPLSAGIWKYRAIVQNENCMPDTSDFATINVLNRTLTIKAYPQGLYNPFLQNLEKAQDNGYDRYLSDTSDLVNVRLIENTMPYNEVCSFNARQLAISGLITIDLPPYINSSYYIALNHRNSIETWSSNPVLLIGNSIFYNFTTGANKAYGFNQKQVGNAWTIYGGDVNQDGIVDAGDMISVDNRSALFETGYLPEDADGSGLIDASDMIIVDNNSGDFINAIFPYAQELPVVHTYPASNISLMAFTANGFVSSQGGSPVYDRGICWSISPEPTIDDEHVSAGSSTGSFLCEISGLSMGTHYYFRAFATNHSGTAYGQAYSFTTLSPGGGAPYSLLPAITYGNQTYNTVHIGSQVWLRENLNIGTRVDQSQNQTDNGILEKYCHEDFETNCDTYGGIYLWDEMMQYSSYQCSQGICPIGWHVPSSAEWVTLATFLGGDAVAGGQMKEAGTKHWLEPNEGATNSSGFSALPINGNGVYGFWINSSLCDPQFASNRVLFWQSSELGCDYGCSKQVVYSSGSVRCVMDDSLKPAAVNTSFIYLTTPESAITGGEVVPNGGTNISKRGVCWSSSPNPTISDSHTADGDGYGTFKSALSGLQPDIIYYVRAYAINSAGIAYGTERMFSTSEFGFPCPGLDSVIYDNKAYKTVQIGDQCWMKQNLNVGYRIDGNLDQSNDSIIEKYCYNDDETNCDYFGGLYQWDEAMQYSLQQGSQGICPEGWHIPTHLEWQVLVDFLGGEGIAGGKMKEFGTASWSIPNAGGNNESGFSALSSGERSFYPAEENYFGSGTSTAFWSSTEYFTDWAFYRFLSHIQPSVIGYEHYEYTGISIRCLKNDSLQLAQVTTAPVSYITSTSALSGGEVIFSGGSPVTEKGVCFDTILTPTVNGPHTSDGSGIGSFVSSLTNLQINTIYYIRAFAVNSGGVSYGEEISFTTFDTVTNAAPCPGMPSVTYENQTYNTVQIGSQCWLKENLNVGIQVDGYLEQTNNGVIEKYCFNDLGSNCDLYGGLYQWKEIMNYSTVPGSRGICPEGWHIPTDEEFCTLTMHIDPTVDCITGGWTGSDVGIKMKSGTGWNEGGNGSDSSGFSAMPAGYRQFQSLVFEALGDITFFWSSTDYNTYSSWHRALSSSNSNIYRFYDARDFGFSVRCIMN